MSDYVAGLIAALGMVFVFVVIIVLGAIQMERKLKRKHQLEESRGRREERKMFDAQLRGELYIPQPHNPATFARSDQCH